MRAEACHVHACSTSLKKLVAMVGRSAPIFRGVVDLVCARLRDSTAPYIGLKEAAYCSLRSQLLMALHDVGATDITAKVRRRSLPHCLVAR
jgi:hypothetical protein